MADQIPAVGYIRVSMMREEAISPELQRAAIEDWAARRGRRITEWITDLDKTGRNFNRRIRDAITAVENGTAREIAVWKYSRFGRDRFGVAEHLAQLEARGGSLQSATEEVDVETATGRLQRGMLLEFNAYESDKIGESWKSVYRWRVKEGLPPVGRPRFGYVRRGRVRSGQDPGRTRRDPGAAEAYEPDPELGPVLRAMYLAYIRGDGGPVIAGRLNERAIPNTYGNPWSGRTVVDVLDSGFGAGFLRVHDPSCRCRAPARCRNRVMAAGAHEPVISREEWEAYRDRRSVIRKVAPANRSPVYPVSGLVRCGHCGAAMTVSGAKRDKGRRFRCSRHQHYRDCPGRPSVPLEDLLGAVRGLLAEIAAELDASAPAVQAMARAEKTARSNAERLGAELAAKDRELANLAIQRARTAALPDSAWEQAAATLTRERAALEARLAAARRAAVAVPADPLPALIGVLDAWDLPLPAPDLNRMLRAVIRQITVWCTAPASRDGKGHFLAQQTRVEVVPVWQTSGSGASVIKHV
jgi:site-specific DNA recombinase